MHFSFCVWLLFYEYTLLSTGPICVNIQHLLIISQLLFVNVCLLHQIQVIAPVFCHFSIFILHQCVTNRGQHKPANAAFTLHPFTVSWCVETKTVLIFLYYITIFLLFVCVSSSTCSLHMFCWNWKIKVLDSVVCGQSFLHHSCCLPLLTGLSFCSTPVIQPVHSVHYNQEQVVFCLDINILQ